MNKSFPKISIIMPSYNQGQFIEESILSVINQNYPNLEFIIIDGGSTDNTLEIIEKYQDKIDFWISEKDRGQTHAINKGFKMATGEVLNWLNSDDILSKNALLNIGNFFHNNENIDVIIGKSHLIDQNGLVIKKRNTMSFSSKALWSFSASMCQPAVYFRKRVLDKVGLLDENLDWVMDQDLYLRMDLEAVVFTRVSFLINFFRLHSNAKSVSNRQKLIDQLDYLITVKHKNSFSKINKLYWLYYRSKRYLINIPTKVWFAFFKIINGTIHYSKFEDWC